MSGGGFMMTSQGVCKSPSRDDGCIQWKTLGIDDESNRWSGRHVRDDLGFNESSTGTRQGFGCTDRFNLSTAVKQGQHPSGFSMSRESFLLWLIRSYCDQSQAQ